MFSIKCIVFIAVLFLFYSESSMAQLQKTYPFYTHTLERKPPSALKLQNDLSTALGEGWSTDNDVPVGQCLSGTMDYIGTPSGSVSMDTAYTYDDVMDQLDYKGDGGFSLPGFEGEVAVNYAHLLKDTDYSQTFVYRATIFLKSRHFVASNQQSPLTWIGQQYVQDPVNFRAYCGDKFVTEQQIGGVLYAAVTFRFMTKDEKSAFNSSLKINLGSLARLNENLSTAVSAVHQSGAISVTAFQIGGDPTKLGRILGVKPGSTEAPLLSCGLSDLAACRKTISEILAYAASPEEGNFSTQFKEDNLASPIGPGVIHNVFQNYATIVPVKMGPSLVTQDILDARARVSQKYEKSLEAENEVSSILNRDQPLSPDYGDQLNRLQSNVASNNALLRRAGTLCYDGDMSQCISGEALTNNKLLPIDASSYKKIISAVGNGGVSYFFPYSFNQYIYSSHNRYFRDQIYTVQTINPTRILLQVPYSSVEGASKDGGLTYRVVYRNTKTGHRENMTLVPDFVVGD